MTREQYRAADAVNFSSLKHILISPAHYQAALAAPREETRAMLLGTLTHSVVLEGGTLADVAVKPENLSLATKDGKVWKESIGDKPIISLQEASDIAGMAASIAANPHAAHLLKQCQQRETPLFANLQGVNCKALLDGLGCNGPEYVILDLKTTDDASPEAFGRKVANLHYDMQAAFYSAILAANEQAEERPYWVWIAVEKTAPYTCVVYSANEWMETGEAKMMRALKSYAECKASGNWPQPWQGIQELPKPKWA